MLLKLVAGILITLFLTGHSLAASGNVQGSVKVKSAKFQEGIVVYIKDLGGNFKAPANPVTLDQVGLKFVPHILPILDGTTILFKNSDTVKHNVFSPDYEQYDLGSWGTGGSKKRTYTLDKNKKMKAYVQLCSVHPEMESYVIVLPNPYFAKTDAKGHFTIKGVPAGTYLLGAWSEKYKPREVEVTIPANGVVQAEIDFTK